MTHDEVVNEARKRLSHDAGKKELRDSLQKLLTMVEGYHWEVKKNEPFLTALKNWIEDNTPRS